MDQQHYSSCSSKINSKAKKESKALSSSTKKVMKLSTDPQSVAARERRHRISDRFKILQSLVPGGSKMDTVTMLEEAIQYVKFLKAQIWFHETMISFVEDQNIHLNNMNSMDYQQIQQVPSYNYDNTFQQAGFPFSDGDQFRREETNVSGDAFMY